MRYVNKWKREASASLQMKIFKTLWKKSSINFFAKIYACFEINDKTFLFSLDYPINFIIVTNSWENISMLLWCREEVI